MKTLWITVAMLTLVVSSAAAVDIDGKWGIGAGLFNNGGGEVSFIRGKSERSAWLFDVAAVGTDQVFETGPAFLNSQEANSNALALRLGPGYRRFVRPTEAFSPYWDFHVRGTFNRSHQGGGGGSGTRKVAGVGGDFSFGLEYFTRWSFSVAAHTSLITLDWSHETVDFGETPDTDLTRHGTSLSIGLSPALFIRGYF
jgi:hypothetical protein